MLGEVWGMGKGKRVRDKNLSQYCSVKDFQLLIWFEEKVKG
ncbi:hypothetical protein FDUTEX481_09209 [Tolypothrix sp. PCC 7601]|nr:hypothetical protein FDUTEX481_09209 [Tolypothrix sp. PCC 7601]